MATFDLVKPEEVEEMLRLPRTRWVLTLEEKLRKISETGRFAIFGDLTALQLKMLREALGRYSLLKRYGLATHAWFPEDAAINDPCGQLIVYQRNKTGMAALVEDLHRSQKTP
jgi:hypothetical protein